jgi:putative transcriptional regulator
MRGRQKRGPGFRLGPKGAFVARRNKRNIGDEILEGLQAIRDHYAEKITLRTYKIEESPLPEVDAHLIRDTRERLRVSRRVFARQLRVNERTLEKWEQGRARPNKQAAALILLARKFPDTLQRLAQLAA